MEVHILGKANRILNTLRRTEMGKLFGLTQN